MSPELAGLLDGLHFHTLCEQGSDALEITLNAVAERFGDVLPRMKWLNFGRIDAQPNALPRLLGGAAKPLQLAGGVEYDMAGVPQQPRRADAAGRQME